MSTFINKGKNKYFINIKLIHYLFIRAQPLPSELFF